MVTKPTPPKPEGWGDDVDSKNSAPATIEDRLTKLESGNGTLTPQEVTGLRTLLDRSGFDRKKGKF